MITHLAILFTGSMLLNVFYFFHCRKLEAMIKREQRALAELVKSLTTIDPP